MSLLALMLAVAATDPQCAASFGAVQRPQRAIAVVESPHAIDIIQRRTALRAPTVGAVPWLVVERTLRADPPKRPAAQAIVASRECTHTVHVGTVLPHELVVVAIVDAGLLVERSGELFFIVARDKVAPAFRMVLQSEIVLP